jgi:hypothetical protein
MAIQHRLGILSQRRFGGNFINRVACCLTSLGANSGRRGNLPFTGSIIGTQLKRVGVKDWQDSCVCSTLDALVPSDLFSIVFEKGDHCPVIVQTFWRSGRTAWVSFCNPSSNRVFTVPSGARVAMAISLWLSPLKKASSSASR